MSNQGEMTRDELAQLLLCYIGTAADIIEFFDSFKVTSDHPTKIKTRLWFKMYELNKNIDFRIPLLSMIE